jgi:hypothetical protein
MIADIVFNCANESGFSDFEIVTEHLGGAASSVQIQVTYSGGQSAVSGVFPIGSGGTYQARLPDFGSHLGETISTIRLFVQNSTTPNNYLVKSLELGLANS